MREDVHMTKRGWNMKLFTGNANPILAQEIADFLQTPLSGATVSHFSDGEINVAINEKGDKNSMRFILLYLATE